MKWNEHLWSAIRKFTHAHIPILAKFFSIAWCFATKKLGIFRIRLSSFLRWNFLSFAERLNIFVSFLLPVDGKKINRTKFEIEEENTKLQIARKPPWYPLLFWLLNDRQEKFIKFWKSRGIHGSKMKKIKDLAELSLGVSPFFCGALALLRKQFCWYFLQQTIVRT